MASRPPLLHTLHALCLKLHNQQQPSTPLRDAAAFVSARTFIQAPAPGPFQRQRQHAAGVSRTGSPKLVPMSCSNPRDVTPCEGCSLTFPPSPSSERHTDKANQNRQNRTEQAGQRKRLFTRKKEKKTHTHTHTRHASRKAPTAPTQIMKIKPQRRAKTCRRRRRRRRRARARVVRTPCTSTGSRATRRACRRAALP